MKTEDEKMELTHEPVPGYTTAFYITIAVTVIHLGFIFIRCLLY